MHHWIVEQTVLNTTLTREDRSKIDQLEDRMLGRLEFVREAPSELDELEAEIGIPRPSWFTAMTPTISDVNMMGLAQRRS